MCEFVLYLISPLLNCLSGAASPDAISINDHHSLYNFGGFALGVGVKVAVHVLQAVWQIPRIFEIVVIERIYDIGMIDEFV